MFSCFSLLNRDLYEISGSWIKFLFRQATDMGAYLAQLDQENSPPIANENSENKKMRLRRIGICSRAQDCSLQTFCSFSVVETRLRLRFWTAIREKCLDKFVDTFLEEPANQRDEAEDAENEYHQIRCWRSHFRRYQRRISVEKRN